MLGNNALNLPFSTFELKGRGSIPNDVASLVGRRFATSIETSESARLNEARVKSLTGGDAVTARFLYGEYFTFHPVAKFWLAFNHKPRVDDDSYGFWRRIRLVHFSHVFKEKSDDKKLTQKLKAEAPGILAWAVKGCLEWQKDGLKEPLTVRRETEKYREECDPFADFLGECCVIDPEGQVPAGELWEEYCAWVKDSGYSGNADRKKFAERLKARGRQKSRQGHDRTWTWTGIRLKENNSTQHSSKEWVVDPDDYPLLQTQSM